MEMLLRSVTDRNGLSISFAYENGYPTQMHTPAGDVISFVFSNGKLTELRDQHGRAIQYRYQNDHLTEVVQMDGGVSRYEYSKKGYLTKRIDPAGNRIRKQHYHHVLNSEIILVVILQPPAG